jgi:hypothetical protein
VVQELPLGVPADVESDAAAVARLLIVAQFPDLAPAEAGKAGDGAASGTSSSAAATMVSRGGRCCSPHQRSLARLPCCMVCRFGPALCS